MYINLFSAESHSNEFNIKVHSNTTFYISPLPPTPYLTSRLHAHSRHYTFRNLLKWRQLSSPHKPLFCNLLYIHDFDLIRISLNRFSPSNSLSPPQSAPRARQNVAEPVQTVLSGCKYIRFTLKHCTCKSMFSENTQGSCISFQSVLFTWKSYSVKSSLGSLLKSTGVINATRLSL